ncbi:MAG: hypothetical protein FWC94_02200 [Bacteroidales bacterium]|nr:hypothetical protein [Bacteroidales bacterium]
MSIAIRVLSDQKQKAFVFGGAMMLNQVQSVGCRKKANQSNGRRNMFKDR